MSVIDIETLIQEVSPDLPCGKDPEYDPAFGRIEQAAKGKSARFLGKKEVEAAVPPDWRLVRDSAPEIFLHTKDLRVAIHFIRALLHFNGLQGLQDGLHLLSSLLQKYWDCIHPQFDPDDNNDPVRINILQILCDSQTVLHDIREIPLVYSPALGRFSLHYVNVAQGKLSLPEGVTDTPKMATFDAAFRDENTDTLAIKRELDAVVFCQQHLKSIREIFTEKVGINNAPNFNALIQLLHEIEKLISARLPLSDPVKESLTQESATHGDESTAVEMRTAVPTPVFKSDQINTREDAILLLDKICEYFERQEPSSPVPMLLSRAKRLIAMDFMEILRDLAPNGIQQVEVIRGPEQKD